MLLVTRPRDQALQWVAQLHSRGVPAAAVPLLSIHPASDSPEMAHARERFHTGGLRALMFVSPNAVDAFFSGMATTWPAQTLAVAPGPGTAAALLAQGVPAAQLVQPPTSAAQFDSESLWPELASMDWRGAHVLVVRGDGGRDWLMERWREAGACVQVVAAYRRGAPQPTPEEVDDLLAALDRPEAFIWLLSSSESLDHLLPMVQAQHSGIDAQAWLRRARAVVTHPRILESAKGLGFGRVQSCRPDMDSVVDSYNRLHRDS